MIIPSARVLEYAMSQNGDLAHLAYAGRSALEKAISVKAAERVALIREHCVTPPRTVLEIGSGVGFTACAIIDALGSSVHMVDGEDSSPKVVRSDQFHCSREVVAEFMGANGRLDGWTYQKEPPRIRERFDLVVSFAAWCFHFSPAHYMEYVIDHIGPQSIVIADVRRERPHWHALLGSTFRVIDVIEYHKFTRTVMRLK